MKKISGTRRIILDRNTKLQKVLTKQGKGKYVGKSQ